MPAEGLTAVTSRISDITDRFLPAGPGTSFADQLAGAMGGPSTGPSVVAPSTTFQSTGLLLGAWLNRGPSPGSNQHMGTFVSSALSQTGDVYRFGAQADPADADPTQFDCSELVRWSAYQAGMNMPDGSWNQYLAAKAQGLLIPVEEALATPGALLFSFSEEPQPGMGRPDSAHVAISLGDGTTIEARGTKYGVGSFGAADRFQYAALVPGLGG
jgi:cell wall-associated NlpC family hydrolase